MHINADWLTHETTQRLMGVFAQNGYKIYCVGGCVRNALLGQPVADVDMSTDATPQQMTVMADRAGLRTVPTGIDHGTLTFVLGDKTYEVTSFRKDVATDGRRAVVAFSRSIQEDALRRDFTMNAIYVQADGLVIDPLGGLPDLHARRMCFIEDAHQRIEEDFLRILRFFRFHAWYGDPREGLDMDALAAIADNLDGLEKLSKERVSGEVIKLLNAPDPAPALAGMDKTGVLNWLISGATAQFSPILSHLEEAHNQIPRWSRRLVILGGENQLIHMRLSNAQLRTYETLQHAMNDPFAAKINGHLYGPDVAIDAAMIAAASAEMNLPPDVITMAEAGASAVFPVAAQDLMPQFEGAELGEKLKNLKAIWLSSGMQASKTDLLNQVRKS